MPGAQTAKETIKKLEQQVETTKGNSAETEKRVMEKVEEAVAERTRLEVKTEELNKQIDELKTKLEGIEK